MQPTQPPAGGFQPYSEFPGCYRHPDRPTGVRCARCNRPICPECQRVAPVGFQCPDDVKAGAASVRRGRTIVGATVTDAPPFVSYGLIALNVVAYLATALSPGGTLADNRGSKLFIDWLLVPSVVADQHQYFRLISSAFLHIGPIHLAFNMFALYMLGPGLERALGWLRFSAVYFLGALGGSVATMLFGQVSAGTAGASGAIFGLFACALLLTRAIGLDSRSLIITIVLNFVITFSVPGISKLGHIGGFVLGGLATLALLGWSLKPRPMSNRTQIQTLGIGGLLTLLVVATIWRVGTIPSRSAEITGAGLVSYREFVRPEAWQPDGPHVIHSVDIGGENYIGVITGVEDLVDNEHGLL
jgi:membrane associated rhomboid family serine protease